MPAMLFAGKGTLHSAAAYPYLMDAFDILYTTLYPNNTFRYYASWTNGDYNGHEEASGEANANYPFDMLYHYTFFSPEGMPKTARPACFIHVPSGIYFYAQAPYWDRTLGLWQLKMHAYTAIAPTVYWFYNPISKAPSSDTYGLRVYDGTANNNLVFDSGWGHFGSVRDIVPITFANNASASYLSIGKPAFLYVNSYVSIESSSSIYRKSETRVDWSGMHAYSSLTWLNSTIALTYYRYLKYTAGATDHTLTLNDRCVGCEQRESSPHPYVAGSSNGQYADAGGSSPSGGTLYIPIIDASLFD